MLGIPDRNVFSADVAGDACQVFVFRSLASLPGKSRLVRHLQQQQAQLGCAIVQLTVEHVLALAFKVEEGRFKELSRCLYRLEVIGASVPKGGVDRWLEERQTPEFLEAAGRAGSSG